MKRKCIADLRLNGLIFVRGCEYNISYNDYDGRIYIYDLRGAYTDIPKYLLDRFFL